MSSGGRTTPDTLVGLNRVLNGGIIYFALLFGVINIITSFIISLQATREIFWWDFKIGKNKAWFLAAVVPLVLFILGARNITAVVSVTGAVTGGIIGVVMIFLARSVASQPQKNAPFKISIPSFLACLLAAIFIAGLAYETLSVLKII